MRILICDDDVIFTELLVKYLHEYFNKANLKPCKIAVFHNGEVLLHDKGPKDLVFLDIEMSGISGICVGNALKEENKNIIIFIVTSYIEYLDEAMRFHVFRYLSKPLDKQRLFRNLRDALRLYNSAVTKIPIETKQGISSVYASDIILITAQSRKVIVHTVSGNYFSVHNILYWAQLLNMKCFFQTHRSYIVNMGYVTDFDHLTVRLSNGQFEAYLTRRKYSQFKDAYLLYLESIR